MNIIEPESLKIGSRVKFLSEKGFFVIGKVVRIHIRDPLADECGDIFEPSDFVVVEDSNNQRHKYNPYRTKVELLTQCPEFNKLNNKLKNYVKKGKEQRDYDEAGPFEMNYILNSYEEASRYVKRDLLEHLKDCKTCNSIEKS